MRTQPTQTITPQHAVVTLTGYGLTIRVERGYLHVTDGIADERRAARFHKTDRNLRRLVILGHTGSITLDAIRWLHDARVPLLQLAGDGTILATSGALGRDDARLRRAQATAATSGAALPLTRAILTHKLDGQAGTLDRLDATDAAQRVREHARAIQQAPDLERVRLIEADAARTYWDAWTSVPVTFARQDERRVPDHWRSFGQRISTLTGSPRRAVNPANALLNYLYAILEAETTLALQAVGLDPGIGLMHSDQRARASLALDLMEAARPHVDAFTLDTLTTRRFSKRDLHEARDGGCSILPPLTTELASTAPAWARAIAPHAEWLAQALAHPQRLDLPTPLTQTNRSRAKNPDRKATPAGKSPRLQATCRNCGATLSARDHQHCRACAPAAKTRQFESVKDTARERLTTLRAAGRDPTQTPTAAAKRSQTQRQHSARQAEWEAANPNPPDPAEFESIRAQLKNVPLARMRQATGLSLSYCARVRDGDAVPHPMHWKALNGVAHPPARCCAVEEVRAIRPLARSHTVTDTETAPAGG